jgi:Tfp pilus assembly protein PilF
VAARALVDGLPPQRADFEAALERDKKPHFQAAVHFNLGQLAQRAGDRKAARAAYARSLELRPTKQAQAALDELGTAP